MTEISVIKVSVSSVVINSSNVVKSSVLASVAVIASLVVTSTGEVLFEVVAASGVLFAV